MWAACSKDRPIMGPPPSSPPPPPPLAPSRLVFKVQPTDGVINAALRPIEVAIVDSTGTVVPLDTLSIDILLSIDSVGATLSGTKTVRTHRGIAVFNDLSLDRAGWSFRLSANPLGFQGIISSSGVSDSFRVLYPPGTHLAFRTQPSQAMAAVPIGPVEVVIRDSANHDMPRVLTWVSIALQGGDWFSGSVAAFTARGVARFTDLSFAGPASGLTLKVSTFGLPTVSSNSFDVAARRNFTGSAVAAGAASSCALDTQGAAWCWGDNLVGQLGDGREVSIPRPNPIAGDITFSQISMTKQSWHGTVDDPARSIACGTSTAGVVYCWGGGAQPFNGIDASTGKPFGAGFQMAGVGHEYACGLESDGALQCWGYYTPLGYYGGRTGDDKFFTQLTTGGDHICALTAEGAAFCWLRSQEPTSTPIAVPGSHVFQTITAGDAHTCGLDREGVAWCWGWRYAPLGDSVPATGTGAPDPVRVKTDQRFSSIGAGGFHTCALAADGRAWCWGNNWSGALGDGTAAAQLVPTAVSGGHAFTAISGGGRHTCAVTAAGDVWCWGANGGGQLGNGTWRESHTPVRVVGDDAFVSVSAGGDATCGVTTTGAGRCWGDNTGGELGDGHPLIRPVPGRVLGGHTFTSISAGYQLACGLTANSETWCWGYVRDSVEKRPTPLRLSADPGFRSISAGTYHGCGIDRDGAGWCWGQPTLGNGSKDASVVPVRVSGGLKLDAISVGGHACALTTDGDVYCWGQLTVAPWTDFSTPTLVPGGLKFVALGGGGDHDCALTATGDAYCWGQNVNGQLGDGTHTESPTPRLVAGGLHFTSISAGYGLTCGITAEKQAYCWRDDPNNAGWARPTLVPGNLRFESIDVSRIWGAHACGVATTGALYCWGANRSGQLGMGGTSYEYEPTPKLVVGGLSAAPPQ